MGKRKGICDSDFQPRWEDSESAMGGVVEAIQSRLVVVNTIRRQLELGRIVSVDCLGLHCSRSVEERYV